MPTAPSGLSVAICSPYQLNLSWVDNSSNETSFAVDRSTDPNFTYDLTTTSVGANTTTLAATGLLSNATYYFRVKAVNADGSSAYTSPGNNTTVSIPPDPNVPGNFTATAASSTQVSITWTTPSVTPYMGNGATSYILERATNSAFTTGLFRATPGASDVSYLDTGLSASTTYYYRLRAVDSSGWSSNTSTLSVTTQAGAGQAPTVATAAAATPAPVTATTTALSVLGADDGGEANLNYTWATTGTPPAAVTFSANGTNSAKNTTATFTKAGSYSFVVTIKDATNLTTTSTITVLVNQTLTAIAVTPTTGSVQDGNSIQFSATANDQFGQALANQPTFTWSIDSGGVGSVNSSGLYTAPGSGSGSASVRASSGAMSGTAAVTVTVATAPVAPTGLSATAQGPNQVYVSWTDNANNETNYVLERATDPGFNFDLVTTLMAANATNCTLTGLLANVSYYFRVRALNGSLASSNSNTSIATTATVPSVPNTPTGLTATAASSNQINLTWSDVTANQYGYAETSYLLERATDSAFTQNLTRFIRPQDSTSYSDTSVSGSTGYYYRLRAVNSFAWSNASTPANATTPVAGPTVATPASAAPGTVAGTSTILSVLGADSLGESALSYTWAAVGNSPSGATFSANGSNAAKNTTVTFTQAGSYNFVVTIRDTNGLTTTSGIGVQVNQTLTAIVVTPASGVSVQDGDTRQFAAIANDQFGNAMITQPGIVWSIDAGGLGTTSSAGLYTAPTSGVGSATVRATAGTIASSVSLNVVMPNHPVAVTDTDFIQQINTPVTLQVLSNDTIPQGRTVHIISITQPAHGTAQIVAGTNGSPDTILYTPDAGYVGGSGLTYQVQDNQGNVSTGSVSLTVIPGSAPQLGSDSQTGATTYTLNGGFLVNPNSVFAATAFGNYTYTLTKPINTTDSNKDEGGNNNSIATTGAQTITVTCTQSADGTWTYSEIWGYSATASTSPVVSTSGTTQGDNTTHSYTFTANGNAIGGGSGASSSFTFTSYSSDSVIGSMAGDTTGTWNSFVEDWSTLGNSSASGAVTSASSGEHGDYLYTKTITAPYTYGVDGGTVGGSITTTTGLSGGSHYDPDGTGGGGTHMSVDVLYLGGGGYSYATTGGAVSGTIGENGDSGWSTDATWDMARGSDGVWTVTGGSGSGGGHTYNFYHYDGNGTYHDGTDGGTITESGLSESGSLYTLTLGVSSGAWTSSGIGSGNSRGEDHWHYSGGGTYSYPTTGGVVSGTTTSYGGDDSSYHYIWDMAQSAGASWQLTTGTGKSSSGSEDHSTYSGGGGYNDGSTHGTITEGGYSDSGSGAEIDSSIVSGGWVDSGTGTWFSDGGGNWSAGGSGTYLYLTTGGSVSGTNTVGASTNWSSSYNGHLVMDANGQWSQDTGTGQEGGGQADNWTYIGSGGYFDGFMGGTINEDGTGSDSSGYGTNSTWNGSAWVTTGSAVAGASKTEHWSSNGSASYIAPTTGGSIHGKVTTGGGVTWGSGYTETLDLGSDGSTWVLSSGTGSDYGNASGNYIWSGKGNYAAGTTSGTVNQSGSDTWTAGYSIPYSVVGGAWTNHKTAEDGTVTPGTSYGTDSGFKHEDYNGSGTYSRTFDEGVTSGTTGEKGSRDDNYDYHYNGTLDANGGWHYSGNGSDNVINSDSSWYDGGGSSDYTYNHDTVGSGTSDNPDHSDSYMSNSSLDEHGSVTTTTSNLKAWVMGNDGTWVQSSQTIGYSGSGGKGSTYTFNDDDQTHDVETQVFPDSSVLVNKDNNDVSNSHNTTVNESYSYNNGITIDGSGPTTWGGGSATRTTTSEDGSVQSGNWEIDAPQSPTVAGTSSSNSSSNSTKKYTEAWGPAGISTRLEIDSTTNTHTVATATIGGVPVTGSPSVTDTPSSDHETITGSSGLDFLYSGTPNAATFVGKAIGGAWTRATVTVNADGTETYTPAADGGGTDTTSGGTGNGGSGTSTGGGASAQPSGSKVPKVPSPSPAGAKAAKSGRPEEESLAAEGANTVAKETAIAQAERIAGEIGPVNEGAAKAIGPIVTVLEAGKGLAKIAEGNNLVNLRWKNELQALLANPNIKDPMADPFFQLLDMMKNNGLTPKDLSPADLAVWNRGIKRPLGER